ncbi:MAG: ligand-binding sensor domain-containing protein, partial [Candidatus Eiseniibacteriota bacterium]
MRFRALLIVALISLAPLPALAAWQSYTNRDGLTNNTVHLVLADRSGGLWVVTDAPGVSRYDGVAWHYYRQADGLPSDTITTILESRSGALWFGTPYGVSRYDGTSWGPILAPGGLTSTYVLASMEDHLGKLWVGTATGASFYDGNSWTPVTKAHGLLNYDVTALVEDRAGNIWFGAYEDGVSKYDGNSIITYGPIMFGNYLNGNFMAADSSGNVWLSGTTGETWRFDGATWREYTVNDGLANAFYSGPIFTDRSGQIWESQNGFAVSRFDGQHWRNLSTLNPETRGGLPAGNVLSISQDPDGNLWFGTQTDGLLRFDGSSWRAYALWPGGAAQCYDCGLKDHLGNLWFAAGGKIHKFDGLGWQTFPDPTTLSYNPVYSSVEWPSGKLWFGTFLGVLEFDPAIGQVTPFSPFGSLVLTMERDASGVIWMGTPNGVLRSITPTSFTSYTKANTSGGLPDDFVIKMAEDHAGNHWFSAGGSIVRLGAGQSATETVDASSGVGQYSSLALDSQGEPVIGYYNSSSSDVKIAHHS